ncbi:Methylthioribose-1-phosphate isomerase [Anaerohalosphaera lusitana]|uniref:Methylthioribose-1-phosphate isomerase n=1 Tax=Anaerohalosphaera lusitana TaxID=1936003 RepID=A0A1U9NHR6_9BACT|nr:S-methyl-5-thioribose-1-phosphate isomerase [Anaerohalosphaera lusitana]AQT67345.1 Methylthioribose-1-phosphate isomerase [Anaerohalosphaera lusitana]
MNFKTLEWQGGIDGTLELLDQRKLPAVTEMLQIKTIPQLYEAIKTLAVRGAPAIGVAAAYGLGLALQDTDQSVGLRAALAHLDSAAAELARSRPTAVNLTWALKRVQKCARVFIEDNPSASVTDFREDVLDQAHTICREDQKMCREIGLNGQKLITPGSAIITHCNAGALATAGQGTALSPLYEAHAAGTPFTVYVDETRPLLQGARLTAWELNQQNIPVTLICDNMAASLMAEGKITAVITGADRIAANGDTANKIGTLNLALLAYHFGIPFYIAAPSSTFDIDTPMGEKIVIEQRDPAEVKCILDRAVSPATICAYNPAFDLTPAKYITAMITEKGIIEKPNKSTIAEHLAQ